MNKKGDLTIVILVIGVLAVCVLALLNFYINDVERRSNAFIGLDKIHKINIKAEQGVSAEQCPLGDCYKGEYIKKSVWPWVEDKLLFRVEYYPSP